MQSGSDRPVAGARWAGINRRCGRLCVLLLGLMVSACSNIGQIGNLSPLGNLSQLGSSSEASRVSVAFELVDGPPPAVRERFMRALEGRGRLAADRGGRLGATPAIGCAAISPRIPRAGRRRFRGRGTSTTWGSAGRSGSRATTRPPVRSAGPPPTIRSCGASRAARSTSSPALRRRRARRRPLRHAEAAPPPDGKARFDAGLAR